MPRDMRVHVRFMAGHLKRRWTTMGDQTSNIPTQERIALRIRDASAVSGLSRSTLYELLKAGKLRAVKIGGRRLILRE
jgi:excisionase family DNA binding protein